MVHGRGQARAPCMDRLQSPGHGRTGAGRAPAGAGGEAAVLHSLPMLASGAPREPTGNKRELASWNKRELPRGHPDAWQLWQGA
jgi:hypothetical protein